MDIAPCEQVKREIQKYEWDSTLIMAIAKAENRTCDPGNHNLSMSENHGVCVGSYGVLQVGCLHYKEGENYDDLSTNVKVAYRVWQQQGYNAWTQYRNGAYQQFIR